MSDAPSPAETVAQWVRKAEDDLRVAETAIGWTGADYWVAMYHAQQCAEKYLKALLTHLEIEFPRVHDIADLLELVPRDLCPEIAEPIQEDLTYYATTGRYPGAHAASRESTRAALDAVRACGESEAPSRLHPRRAMTDFEAPEATNP